MQKTIETHYNSAAKKSKRFTEKGIIFFAAGGANSGANSGAKYGVGKKSA